MFLQTRSSRPFTDCAVVCTTSRSRHCCEARSLAQGAKRTANSGRPFPNRLSTNVIFYAKSLAAPPSAAQRRVPRQCHEPAHGGRRQAALLPLGRPPFRIAQGRQQSRTLEGRAVLPGWRHVRCGSVGGEIVPATDLPQSAIEMVEQAAEAIRRARDGGTMRHMLRLLLPVNEKEANFNGLDPVDYPCSLAKEFSVAINLGRLLIEKLGGETYKTVEEVRLDEGGVEGEPCSRLLPFDNSVAVVVYPTAERLPDIRQLAEKKDRLLIIINPQWRESGQVISDFGIGPWKKAAMDFLDTFLESYSLIEQRIGNPGSVDPATNERYTSGAVVRILRCWPGNYEVFVMAPNGSRQRLAEFKKPPTYGELDEKIRSGRKAGLEIFKIARKSSAKFSDGSEVLEEVVVVAADGAGGSLSAAQVDAMDGAALRKLLVAKGLPSSGKLDKLRARVKEAYL
eukprot:jgi/Botrbrau1/8437/Bobra.0237s0056.1